MIIRKLASFTATGHGVSVAEFDPARKPSSMPRNVFEEAARNDDLQTATALIAEKLGLTSTQVCDANLSEAARWHRLPIDARLREIAGWMVAECYELMDLVEIKPVSTIGD